MAAGTGLLPVGTVLACISGGGEGSHSANLESIVAVGARGRIHGAALAAHVIRAEHRIAGPGTAARAHPEYSDSGSLGSPAESVQRDGGCGVWPDRIRPPA